MNAITIEAIKLLLQMSDIESDTTKKNKLATMVDKLLSIMEKDIDHAFQQYATVKIV